MRRQAPVLTLFFLTPTIAELFLGTFPIVLLPVVLVLAPMYGGGALLIRELARRTHRGWPTMMTLALAFGVLEEGLLTQSLFNPDYADAHLLDSGFIAPLGTAIPWAVFVLALHTIWSISTPIAIVEESTHGRQTRPWLGRTGLAVAGTLFVVGCVITFFVSYGNGHFMAKPGQLTWCAVIAAILVLVAFRLPKVNRQAARRTGWVPNPWLLFAITMVAGVIFMAGTALPVWVGVAAMLAAVVVTVGLAAAWSARSAWGPWHRFALACGALFTYSWHAFTMGSGEGTAALVLYRISDVIYLFGALYIARLALQRIRRQSDDATQPAPDTEPAGAGK